jgi:outer membrane autotransporter protein
MLGRATAGAGESLHTLSLSSGALTGYGRSAFLAMALMAGVGLWAQPSHATDATWLESPASNAYGTGSNWTGSVVPDGTAFFGASDTTALSLHVFGTTVGGWTFNAGAGDYEFSNPDVLTFDGAGIVVNGGSVTITTEGYFNSLTFNGTSTAGSAAIINGDDADLIFNGTSTAGSATITDNGSTDFNDSSSAGNAIINTKGWVRFNDSSSAGSAAITTVEGSFGYIDLGDNSTLGSATIVNNNYLRLFDNSTAGSATITNNATMMFNGTNSAGNATITNNKTLDFLMSSTAGQAQIITNAGGVTSFSRSTGPLEDGRLTAGSLAGAGSYDLGANEVTVGGNNLSTEVSGTISGTGTATGTSLVKIGSGTLTLSGDNTYSGGTTIKSGTLGVGSNTALGTSKVLLGDTLQAAVDGLTLQNGITLLGESGTVDTQAHTLTLAGILQDDILEELLDDPDCPGVCYTEIRSAGSLTKTGTGTLVLTNENANYTGGTNIKQGTLAVGASNALGAGRVILGDATLQAAADGLTLRNDITLGSEASTVDTQAHTLTLAGILRDDFYFEAPCFDCPIEPPVHLPGSLTKTGAGTLVLTNDNTYTGDTVVKAGKLVVNGSIQSNVFLMGGTLGGSGQIGTLMLIDGTLAPGNSIGTMTVNGDFSLGSGTVYEVEVNAAGKSDQVVVMGTVSLAGALSVLAENGTYAPSTKYTIIDNDKSDAVTGSFSSLKTNFAFLDPSVVYNGGDGNDVVLTLTRNEVSAASFATSSNQARTANALVPFTNNCSTSDPFCLALLNQTVDSVQTALDAVSGEIHATVAGTLADDSRYARDSILGRLMQASHAGGGNTQTAALAAAGPQMASLDAQAMALGYGDGSKSLVTPERAPLAFWTRAYGAWGDFNGDGSAASADRDLGGFISGMDAGIGGSWRAGLATGASFSSVDVDARYSSADVETYHLGGYLGGMAGSFALRGGGMWAWSDVDTSRAVVFPGFFERETASYDADTGQIFGEVAYPTQMGGVALEPFGGLAFVSVDTDSFRERGGSAALIGRDTDQDVGYSTLGLRAASTMHWGAMLVVPHISAAWQHAFDDVTPDAALAFAATGAGFVVRGVPLGEDTALIDAGLDFALGANTTAGVSYTGQFGDGVQDNGVKGRFTWLF